MSMIHTFGDIENKHDIYKSEECIRYFCKSLIQHLIKVINFEKKKMIPLTKE